MTAPSWLPLLSLVTSVVPALASALPTRRRHAVAVVLTLCGAAAQVGIVTVMLVGVARGERYEWRAAFLPELDLVLRAEPLPLLLVSLCVVLWATTTVYAIGYLAGSARRARFLGFFNLCITGTLGAALAGNLLTFLVFYELLTVATYPLVIHDGGPTALSAARRFLVYAVGGGAVLLAGIVWLHTLAGAVDLAGGGVLGEAAASPLQLRGIFALLVAGLGVKAALAPLHLWLPGAHSIAPGPASALLSGLTVKTGVYGIVRVIYDLFGSELAIDIGVLAPLAGIAAVTIVYGGLRALTQDDLKRRLAYSTVSQLSYVTLGAAVAGQLSATASMVHVAHHGIMKATLFYCAGNLVKTLGVHRLSDLRGVGQRMPVTMAAFTVASLGLIGVPPTAGFVSKWFLGLGGLGVGAGWVIPVLVASSLLSAAYLLPIVYRSWFVETETAWPERPPGARTESSLLLLAPPVVTASATVLVGLLAASTGSPLSWASAIAEAVFA